MSILTAIFVLIKSMSIDFDFSPLIPTIILNIIFILWIAKKIKDKKELMSKYIFLLIPINLLYLIVQFIYL